MLLATRHKRTLTPASMGGTRFTYPEGWKAELTRWLDYPGRESNPRPLGRKSDALAAVPPGQERPMRIKPSYLHHCHLTTNSATNSAAAGCSLTSSSNISTSMEHIDRVNRAVCWTCDNLTKFFLLTVALMLQCCVRLSSVRRTYAFWLNGVHYRKTVWRSK